MKWHKGSRFWLLGMQALWLGAVLCVLVIFRVPEAVPEALGMYGGLGAVILGGGTWQNLKDRDVYRAQAEAGQEPGAPASAGAEATS